MLKTCICKGFDLCVFPFSNCVHLPMSEGNRKILCAKAGCVNVVARDNEYCSEHHPDFNKSTICLSRGCTNTADFNDNNLCMVCFHTQKLALRNSGVRSGNNKPASRQCLTIGCNNNATDMNKCDSCNGYITTNNPLETQSFVRVAASPEQNISNEKNRFLRYPIYQFCVSANCTNVIENNGQDLCRVCVMAQNHISKNKGGMVEDSRDSLRLCSTSGCMKNATYLNKCDSCYQQLNINPFPSYSYNPQNVLTENSTTDPHSPVSNTEYKKCAAPRCTNPAEYDGGLCMICGVAEKYTVGNETAVGVEDTNASSNLQWTKDTFHHSLVNSQNRSSVENARGPVSCTQNDLFSLPIPENLHAVDLLSFNNPHVITSATSCSIDAADDASAHGNVVFSKSSLRRRMVCEKEGCNKVIAFNGKFCHEHQEKTPTGICAMKGCTNHAEPPQEYLCMICLHAQKRTLKENECQRRNKPIFSSCASIETNPPVMTSSNLVSDSSSPMEQTGKVNFDLNALVRSLPPIPIPTLRPNPSIQGGFNPMEQSENSGIVVLARGISASNNNEPISSNMPIPFSSLPPIPIPRSMSHPDTNTTHAFQQFDVDALTSRADSLPDNRTISSLINNNPESCVSPSKEICKAPDCKFFVNEGLGGYCSECFMLNSICENMPPSPTRGYPFDILNMENEYASIGRIDNQLCKKGECEFFGNDDFEGYCSGCYKEVSEKANEQDTFRFIPDDDDKMCIICLQNVYNTVLLPCGHLYLCFECATIVKDKGKKCPACRSPINSFHRVYTPD